LALAIVLPEPVSAAVVWEWEAGDPCIWYWDDPQEMTSCDPTYGLYVFTTDAIQYLDYWRSTNIVSAISGPVTLNFVVSEAHEDWSCDDLEVGIYDDENNLLQHLYDSPWIINYIPAGGRLSFHSMTGNCYLTLIQIGKGRITQTRPRPPNDDLRINSENVIMSGELPAPLPSLPGRISLPDITLPLVDHSQWPDTTTSRNAAWQAINASVADVRTTINEQYSNARSQVAALRSTTQSMRDFIGNPASTVSQGYGQSFTVTGMASQMSNSVASALGYVRAVSAIGPMGLDLVVIFIGLGWVLFLNFFEWLMMLIVSIIKTLAGIVVWFFRVLEIIMAFVRTIRAVLPF